MDTKRYLAFVTAVEKKSLSAAGKELGYTPSGIIRLINALEAETGFPLLVRSSTGVELTAEGARLFPLYREMTELEGQARRTSERIRGLAEGSITVGALDSIATLWLPQVIAAYQESFPAVRVNVVEASDTRLAALLEQHSIDLCLFHGDHAKFQWTALDVQQLVVWLPAHAPLLRHKALLLAELDGQPFVRIHPEDSDTFERLFTQKGLEPDVRFTVGSSQTAYALVAQGLGMSLYCNGVAERWRGAVATRPLSPARTLEFGAATLAGVDPSPAVEAFIEVAKRFTGTWPRS